MDISKEIRNEKKKLLTYFRDRATEFIAEVNDEYGNMNT